MATVTYLAPFLAGHCPLEVRNDIHVRDIDLLILPQRILSSARLVKHFY